MNNNFIKYLIINADDFGLSKSINEGIIKSFNDGVVTSTSLMANGYGFDDAILKAKENPNLDIGIHLNIYRYRSLSPKNEINSLVNNKGEFFTSYWKVIFGAFNLEEVEKEFRLQIEKVLSSGIKPSHIDGEKHLHLWPPIFLLVARLAREYDINFIRLVKEWAFPFNIKSLVLGLLSLYNSHTAKKYGLKVVSSTIGLYRAPRSLASLSLSLKRGRGELVEYFVHPGYIDEEFLTIHQTFKETLLYSREEELRILTNLETKIIIEKNRFKPSTFKEHL